MASPIPRNVRRACTKVFHYPYYPQVPYDENIQKPEKNNYFYRSEGDPHGLFCPWARWTWGLDYLGSSSSSLSSCRQRPPWTHFPPKKSIF